MMPHPAPVITADARGLWEQRAPGPPALAAAWGDIVAVGGACYDAGDRTLTCVEFDLISGEFLEVFTDWPGFSQVAQAAADLLPGLAPGWLQTITALAPTKGLTVWRREAISTP